MQTNRRQSALWLPCLLIQLPEKQPPGNYHCRNMALSERGHNQQLTVGHAGGLKHSTVWDCDGKFHFREEVSAQRQSKKEAGSDLSKSMKAKKWNAGFPQAREPNLRVNMKLELPRDRKIHGRKRQHQQARNKRRHNWGRNTQFFEQIFIGIPKGGTRRRNVRNLPCQAHVDDEVRSDHRRSNIQHSTRIGQVFGPLNSSQKIKPSNITSLKR
jgi:hypothetical protein